MCELDCEEGWAPKNWCFWTVVLEKTLESPLDCKEIQPVHSEGDQPWDFLEGMMLKLKVQYFGHLMRRVDSLKKSLMLGRIGGRRRRGWQRMRWLDGITDSMDVESRWTPGVGEGQGGLACCDSWGRKESDTTERLIWSDLITVELVTSFQTCFQSYLSVNPVIRKVKGNATVPSLLSQQSLLDAYKDQK